MSEINYVKFFIIMQNNVTDDVGWMLMWHDLIGY
jgi:hypothetical protein